MISFEDFSKIELRVVKIAAAERVEGSDKLIRLTLEAGDTVLNAETNLSEPAQRTVVAGIGKAYEPEQLIGKQIVIIANLEPRKLMGIESNGMLLAARDENGAPVILTPQRDVPPGTRVS